MSAWVLVAIGSNLPDRFGRPPAEICRAAVERLASMPGWQLLAVSAWYRTAPVPAADQPDYVNGVARFAASHPAPALLATLHAVEGEAGRTRSVANAARVLDLDLLAVGNEVIRSTRLAVPHPRLHERAFVLDPLCDVAPDWRHPLLGRTAAELRAVLAAPASSRVGQFPPEP